MISKRIKQWLSQLLRGLRRGGSSSQPITKEYLTQLLGEPTQHTELYDLAFTHRSYPKAPKGYNNERLEFLGDSVLSCVVGHSLYMMYQDKNEGELSNLRSYLVSRSNMNDLALRLKLDKALKASNGLNLKQTNTLGNCLEALIGAIYLDKGFDFVKQFIERHIVIDSKNLDKVSAKEEDYKTEFIILMQRYKIAYDFRYIDSINEPQIGIIHRCEIVIGEDFSLAFGSGTSKKIAHQNAAKDAIKLLRNKQELIKRYRDTAL